MRHRPTTSCFAAPTRRLIAALSLFALVGDSAAAEEPKATVDGRYDSTEQMYTYRVTNRSDSPIVLFQIPHYGGDLFLVPNGWRGEGTNLVGQHQADAPGECVARPEEKMPGLAPGETMQFQLRVPNPSTPTDKASSTVGFADGTTIEVPGVAVPVAPSKNLNYFVPSGWAHLCAAVLMRTPRRKTDGGAPRPPADDIAA